MMFVVFLIPPIILLFILLLVFKRARARAIIYCILSVLLFMAIFDGYHSAASLRSMKTNEIRSFKNEEHIDIITSAFQFELNANETLYVSRFRLGGFRESMSLGVVIEGIDSVDSFLSRLNANVVEVDFEDIATHPSNVWFRPNIFQMYETDIFYPLPRPQDPSLQGFSHKLIFCNTSNGINAEFATHRGIPHELVEVHGTLIEYLRPPWLHVCFLLPVAIQVAVIVLAVSRYIRKRNRR